MNTSSFWFQGDSPTPPDPLDPGFPIHQSLRFRGAQRLIRQVSSDVSGDWTLSFWFKFECVVRASDSDNYFFMFGNYLSPLNLYINNNTSSTAKGILGNSARNFEFPGLIRDPSAWYHCVMNKENGVTNGYINGEGPQFSYSGINLTIANSAYTAIGAWTDQPASAPSTVNSFKGYMADWYFIDGQALDPTTFGRYNADGVWVPVNPADAIAAAGGYGANGFHLTFADPNDIGKDYSGNGNDFTATGFDTVPPGVATTIYTESPKNYGSAIDTSTSLGSIPITPATLSSSNTQLFELSVPVKSVTIASLAGVPSGCTVEISADGAANNWTTKINGGSWTDEASGGQVITDANDFKYVRVGFTSNMNWGLISQPSGSVGSDYDLMQDSPTQNFATGNPLMHGIDGGTRIMTYSDGNLKFAGGGPSSLPWTYPSIRVPMGVRAYAEFTNIVGAITAACGVSERRPTTDSDWGSRGCWSWALDTRVWVVKPDGSTDTVNVPGRWTGTAGDVAGVEVNTTVTPPTVTFTLNGANASTHTFNADFDPDNIWIGGNFGANEVVQNFGQQPFLYQPAGTVALQTQNMPAPTIYDGREEFRAITGSGGDGGLFYGNNATQCPTLTSPLNLTTAETIPTAASRSFNSCTIDFGIQRTSGTVTFANFLSPIDVAISADGSNWRVLETGATIQPTYTATDGSDFRYARFWSSVAKNYAVSSTNAGSILANAQAIFPSGLWWIKDMAIDNQHQLVTNLFTEQDPVWIMPQSNPGWADYVPPTGGSVAWCWNAPDDFSADGSGGAQGDIPCTGKINKKAGFSMIKFTNPTQAAKTIAHGLDDTPEFYVMAKDRGTDTGTNASSKYAWHVDLTAGNYIYLDQPGGQTTNNFAGVINAVPNEYVFSIGNAFTANNGDYLTLLWTSIPGYSAFGKYTGNANPDGSFIYTGFKPAFILVKALTLAYPWQIYDTTRSPYNPAIGVLQPDLQTKEISSDNYALDILSNGFKWRAAYTYGNDSTDYIYAAFAENPFQSPVTAR